MQVIQIDKKKNPQVEDLATDLQPGDPVDLHCTIKANDDQFLTLTVEEASEGKEPKDPDEEESTEGNEGSGDEGSDDEMSPAGGGSMDYGADMGGAEQAGM